MTQMIMPNDQDQLIHQSLAAIEANQLPQAFSLLKQALNLAPRDPSLHNNLANLYKKTGALTDAEKHYQEAIQLDPNYPEAHHNLGNLYALQHRFQDALTHYKQALHLAPDYTLAHYHLGLLFLAYQKKEAAQTQFNNVVALCPEFKQANFYLGILALERQDYTQAKIAFGKTVELDPQDSNAHVNLGVIALKEDRAQEAIHHFTTALLYDEHHLDARHNLAATFIHHDRYENALTHYTILLQHDPFHEEYLYHAGVAEMALGRLQKAQTHFKTILKRNAHHFPTLMNLAAISTRLKQHQEAKHLLQLAHRENPTDLSCKHMLNALEGQAQSETCPEYAKHLFDNYALYYDAHLQHTLQYHLPKAIGKLIHSLLPHYASQNTLDLGCGTGLSGVCLREISEQLTGVDLSEKMLNEARKKEIYDRLITAELVDFLVHTREEYDLIVSAEVLPYFGNLEPLFRAVSTRSRGLFIFNVEMSKILPYELQPSARFAHHATYIHTLARQHHFCVIHEQITISRQQDGEDLPVLLFALQKEKL